MTIAQLTGLVYGVPEENVLTAATIRAEAMAYRDARPDESLSEKSASKFCSQRKSLRSQRNSSEKAPEFFCRHRDGLPVAALTAKGISQAKTAASKLDVRFEGETVWLTQKALAELFGVQEEGFA